MSKPAVRMARPVRPENRRLATQEILLPEHALSAPRAAVLTAALKLFAEHGFGGTSVRDIAAEVGIQPATMYAHYPSKQHVLAEIIRIGHDVHRRWIRQELLTSASDPKSQLQAFVRAHVLMHATYSMLAVVTNNELHALAPEFSAPGLTLRHQTEELLLGIIQRGVRKKVFRTPDVWLAMAAIGAMGLRVAHWHTQHLEKKPEQVAEIYAQFACNLLCAKEPPKR